MVRAGANWNLLEMAVASWAGTASSVALIAFVLDSMVELFAGAVLIRHLSHEWKGSENVGRERKALRLVGVTCFLLTVFIVFQSTATLLGWLPEPRESPLGISLVIASAAVMFILYLGKMPIARKLGPGALRAEAIESLACDVQELTVFVGPWFQRLAGLIVGRSDGGPRAHRVPHPGRSRGVRRLVVIRHNASTGDSCLAILRKVTGREAGEVKLSHWIRGQNHSEGRVI